MILRVAFVCLLTSLGPICVADESLTPRMATGIKIGEVTPASAVIWTRTTDDEGGARPGEVAIEWRLADDHSSVARQSEWQATDASSDHVHQFRLQDLEPGATYALEVRSRSTDGQPGESTVTEFTTAPAADTPAPVRFTVVTGQEYHRRDDPDRGHRIYNTMLGIQPSFFVHTGDVVYYDKAGPFAKDALAARLKWNRMYALPFQNRFHRQVPSYFQKDDHDILKDDCWPRQTYGELTWDQGLEIFREQTPAPDLPYRTVRWGQDLQIWLLEGREFRSPNNTPDGSEKTILGQEQFDWLARTTEESDATFRVVISPTPIVGPDRTNKNDNHANRGFQHEGDRLRKLLASREDLYLVCGDRHWQYVSVDPATGLREYSCGPTSDQHAGGWSEDQFEEAMHKFLRVKGGFLLVLVDRQGDEPQITFRHHAVDGEVVHEERWLEGE